MKLYYEGALIIMVAAVVICTILTRKKRKDPLCKSLRWLLVVAGITMILSGLYAVSPNVTFATVVFGQFSAAIDWLLIMFLNYVSDYTDMKVVHRPIIFVAIFISGLDTISFWINVKTHHVLEVVAFYFEQTGDNAYMAINSTIFYTLHLVFCYVLSALIFTLLLVKLIRTKGSYRRKYSTIMILFVILLALDACSMLLDSPFNISMFAYCLICILITYFSLWYIPRNLEMEMQKIVVREMDNIVVCFDQYGQLIFANDKANQAIETSGKSDFVLKHYREWKTLYSNLPDRVTTWSEEGSLSGQIRYYEVVAKKLFDDNDRYIGVYFITYDRTEERNRHQRELDHEREAGERRAQFWATIAHEMRTPMNSILGMNELILREAKDENVLGYAEDVKTATESLTALINDVLDFSRIDSGKMKIRVEEYKVLHLLKNVYTMILPKLREKNLEFKVEVDSYVPTSLLGDELRLQQIMINLLTNAAKYTRKGSVTLRVFGELRFSDFYLHVEVEDTGIGIREESIPLLFEAYHRVNEAQVHGIQGTGLGINITENLLKMMDSHLEVSSVYGEGSIFSFAVKQPPMSMRYVENVESFLQSTAPTEHHESISHTLSGRLLLVDDNDMNRLVFKSLLKNSDLVITDVASGAAALEKMKEERYDVIFLDHLMPEMDGEEVFYRIKEDAENRNRKTPVIMMTANAEDGAKEHFLQIGFDDFLAKPVDPKNLEETIEKWIKK